jgi:RimJ/RimL family protein N-acetyltransferase
VIVLGFAQQFATCSKPQNYVAPVIQSILDEVNAASLRVLEDLGFTRFAPRRGAFGTLFLLRLG